MELEQVRIGIVDDDTNTLKAISCFLQNEADFIVLGMATNKEEAVKMARSLVLDVILMDIVLGEDLCGGIDAAIEIQKFSPAKIIMLTSSKDPTTVLSSFDAGAVNYINKQNYLSLPGMIRETVSDDSPIQVLIKEWSRLRAEVSLKTLSKAEMELFDLICSNHTIKDISKILNKSENTIKNQLHSIYIKINVSGKKEAMQKFGLLNRE